MSRLRRLLAAALAGLTLAAAPPVPVDDGPHVQWAGRTATVLSVRDGCKVASRLEAPWDLPLAGLPPLRLEPGPRVSPPAVLPLPERVAAVSDIHGNLEGLRGLLAAHGVMDRRGAWTFGAGHLVVAGDTFDRGARVADCLWLLRSLEAQAGRAGGRVTVLLGNHDVGALRGDERYLHPGLEAAQKTVLGMDQQALYGAASELGRWLRSLPVLLKLGPVLFVHGGPAPGWAAEVQDIEGFNRAVRAVLDAPGSPRLLGRDAPIWYRGLLPRGEAKRANADDGDVEKLLATLGVQLVVVGHTTQKGGITAYRGGTVHAIDADLQAGGFGELWLFLDGRCFRGLPDGTRIPLQAPVLR